jgi:hypothetical protein
MALKIDVYDGIVGTNILSCYVGYRLDGLHGLSKIHGNHSEAIDPGFYILTALSAVLACAFVVSHWFA